MGYQLPFPYYGGKATHLGWLLPFLLPAQTFCDVYGGSAAVLLNRAPSPVEIYNDLEGDVVNFFRVLRGQPDALIALLQATPYSREEYAQACAPSPEGVSDLERAWSFFIRARQARQGLATTAQPGQWSYMKATSRGGVAKCVSAWLNGIEGLDGISGRLRLVQIEQLPAVELMARYDSRDTLFYCDPPYLQSSRVSYNEYSLEMDEAGYTELALVAQSVQGSVVLSGYNCDLVNDLLPGWAHHTAPPKMHLKGGREESVWVKPPADG